MQDKDVKVMHQIIALLAKERYGARRSIFLLQRLIDNFKAADMIKFLERHYGLKKVKEE